MHLLNRIDEFCLRMFHLIGREEMLGRIRFEQNNSTI